MKKLMYLPLVATAIVGLASQSCSDDNFNFEGQGQLKLKMVINSEVTRAEVDDEQLAENCVVYISSEKGLIHKFKGLDNVPSDLWLKSGHYVGEAWTGDYVTASFDKKFYKAYEPFDIHEGVNNIVLTCRIANVVASVNATAIPDELMSDWTVTVGNTRGALDFTDENASSAKGYFMMPNNDHSLTYVITGKNLFGQDFRKEGVIENVKPAHEYVLNLKRNPDGSVDDLGGAFITVVVDDTELLIEDEIMLHGAPQIAGLGVDISKTIGSSMGTFGDLNLSGVCYGEAKRFDLKFSDKAAFGTEYAEYNLVDLANTTVEELEGKGLTWSTVMEDEHTKMRLHLPASLFNSLENGSYWIEVGMTDRDNRTTTRRINIEVSDAKVILEPVEEEDVTSYTATLTLAILQDDVTGFGMRYRAQGTADWTEATATRSTTRNFYLTGLRPGTTYEAQAFCDGYVNNEIVVFTTEPTFAVPNAGFEDWSTTDVLVSGTPFPGTDYSTTFWDTGNHGSMTMKKAITFGSDVMKHSGNLSACLQSQFVGIGTIGKFAAGNIFSGKYESTNGTKGGRLTLGKPMSRCHPTSLTAYVNYRPGTVEYASTGAGLSKGDMDQGTVYVAILSETKFLDNSADPKILFSPSEDIVLAYGEKVFSSNFGADNTLEKITVPIVWRNKSYKGQYYILIMAASSRYGDYFTGGNSTMYIDDLELIYE